MLCHAQQRPHPLLISAGRELKRAAGQRTLGLSAPGKGAEHGGGTDIPLQDELLQALIPCSSLFLGHFTPCRAKYEEFIIPLSSRTARPGCPSTSWAAMLVALGCTVRSSYSIILILAIGDKLKTCAWVSNKHDFCKSNIHHLLKAPYRKMSNFCDLEKPM